LAQQEIELCGVVLNMPHLIENDLGRVRAEPLASTDLP
jgi:hypothetical protein